MPWFQEEIGGRFVSIVLHASWPNIVARLSGTKGRPLWDEQGQTLYEERREGYLWGDYHVNTDEKPPTEVAEEITAWLQRFG